MIDNIEELRVNMYADDCLIYCIGNNWESMRPKLQYGLDSFQNWCLCNRMKLNVCKSKSLIIGTNQKIGNIDIAESFMLNNEGLEFTDTYNYLGKVLDKNMSLTPLLTRLKRTVIN